MQKFIITSDGFLRMGNVNMHRQLLLPGDHCIGGGYYSFDYVGNSLVLEGASMDYGSPRWNALLDSDIATLCVPSYLNGLTIVYKLKSGGTSSEYLNLSTLLPLSYY